MLSEPFWDYDTSHLCLLELYFSACRRQVNFRAGGFDIMMEPVLRQEPDNMSEPLHLCKEILVVIISSCEVMWNEQVKVLLNEQDNKKQYIVHTYH